MLCSKPCLLTPTPFRSAASAERDGVSVEDVGPALLRTERHQVALRPFPMARKATMLELHPGALRPLLMNAQLDLAGLFGVRDRLAPGLICQENLNRCGGSHTSTRPQSTQNP